MYGLQRRTSIRVRKQLGFAFKDIDEHLPGAFIIYKADKKDDELFYANHEFLHMTGYKILMNSLNSQKEVSQSNP